MPNENKNEQLPSRSWRQGSIISLASVRSEIEAPAFKGDELAILATHDCDVACRSFATEPFVEVLLASPSATNKDEGQLTGKHPRLFQILIQNELANGLFVININNKHRISRKILSGQMPIGLLPPQVIQIMRNWLAKRYNRPAFPDEFNERCKTAQKKLADLLRVDGGLVTNLYLSIDPEDEELEEQEIYSLMLVAACRREIWEDSASRQRAIRLVSDLQHRLNDCTGIRVESAELRSEHLMTLEDVRELDRWDYDYLSYGNADVDHPLGI